jgi:TorA maturation chaperone TorD
MEAMLSATSIPRALAAEEAARADFYALLARLLHDAPDAALLENVAAAAPLPGEGDLARTWRALIDASSAMDAEAAREEFEKLFVGVGKSQVSPYAGFYAGAPAIAHPRIRIQADLAAVGLAHRTDAAEPEDHLAGLFDAMRLLIAGRGSRHPAPLATQRAFYEAHIAPAVGAFFATLARAKDANYYARLAAFGAAFFALETESFSLD